MESCFYAIVFLQPKVLYICFLALVQEFPLPPPPKNFKFRIWNARAYQCCAPRQDLIDDIIGPAL